MAEVKSFRIDPAKQLWRERMIEFIRRHYTPGQLKNLNVLCLAGKEMREVFDIYDVLGVKRKNVVSLEEIAGEYETQRELNSSLDQPITVLNSPTTAYLNQVKDRRFDVVSLDYCGYFDDFKYLDISKLALRGLLGPRAVLVTNYQMAREGRKAQQGLRRTGVFINEHDNLVHLNAEQYRRFILDNSAATDNESTLTKLRDTTVQATPIAEMIYGTGFWNTHYFRTWLSTQQKEYQQDTLTALEEFNLSLGGENRELLSKIVIEGQSRDVCLFMMYFMKSQTRAFDCKDHEAYKYTSDSRTPMISDFYFFEEQRFAIPANLKNSVTYRIKDGQMAVRIKNVKKANQLLRILNQVHWNMYQQSLNQGEIKIPLERFVLKANDEPVKEDYSPPQEEVKIEEPKPEHQPKYVSPEVDKEAVYESITKGNPDDEIMQQFGLQRMQLAGYKAAVTRRQQKEDFPLIKDFLREGESPKDIADLFEGRYSIEKVASLND